MSRRHIHPLLARYRAGGLEALEPRSRRPKANPGALTAELRAEIIKLQRQLLVQGLDAGTASIAWHLKEGSHLSPAISTIRRILKAEGLVTLQPKKRPKANITRFKAVHPNETWQSDFTHWRLKDGRDAPIINWLDDHSRLLLHCTVYKALIGKIVIDTFTECQNEYGTPFSTLTDNGIVYTGRFVKGKNGFEYLLSELEIVQKNGSPGHPESQGKIERFHQTLKELQRQLDKFRVVYNTQRPHKALEMRTPQSFYEATIKATPKATKDKERYQVLHDSVDQFGKLSLRRVGKMHHLGVGIENQIQKSNTCPTTCKRYVTTYHLVHLKGIKPLSF